MKTKLSFGLALAAVLSSGMAETALAYVTLVGSPLKTPIQSEVFNACLNVTSAQSGVALQRSFCGDVNESFSISATSDGYYVLSPASATNLCFDSSVVSESAVLNACNFSAGQKWIGTTNSDGSVAFQVSNASGCLSTASDWSTNAVSEKTCVNQAAYQSFIIGASLPSLTTSPPPPVSTPTPSPTAIPAPTATPSPTVTPTGSPPPSGGSTIGTPLTTQFKDELVGGCVNVATIAAGAVVQRSFCGDVNETFYISLLSNRNYIISSEVSNMLCFESSTAGNNIVLNTCNFSSSQEWSGFVNSDGSYSFHAANLSGCLSTPSGWSSSALTSQSCVNNAGYQDFVISGALPGQTQTSPTPTPSPTPTATPVPTPVPSGATINIGFIGDSITQGYLCSTGCVNAVQTATNKLNAVGYTLNAINSGVSGTTSSNWLPTNPYLQGTISNYKNNNVTIVSIMLGTNDSKASVNTSPAQYLANMQAIVSALLDPTTGIKTVVINEPPYVDESVPTYGNDYAAADNNIVQYIAELNQISGATIGDRNAYSYFYANPSQLQDGVHPSAVGYPALGSLWGQAILNVMSGATH